MFFLLLVNIACQTANVYYGRKWALNRRVDFTLQARKAKHSELFSHAYLSHT